MVDYKVELKEKLKFKEGVGISTYDRGGRKKRTYQYGDAPPPKDTSQKEKRAERIAEQDRIKKAYDKRLAKEEEKRRAVKDEEYDLGKTTTGKYEKGGAVIQETKGDFNTLQFLAAQQPGSRLVQNKAGEYVLIRSSGINLGSDANLLKLNENLELEGRGLFTPTSEKNAEGGTDYTRIIKDTASSGEGKKPKEGKGDPFEKPKGIISTKYNVEVGSNIASAQYTLKQGSDYAITLDEGKKGYQKQRALSPREIAAGMSAGEIPLGFIGSKGAAGVLVDTGQKGQTYVDAAGNPIVTITGQSKGSDYSIFVKDKDLERFFAGGDKVDSSKIFPFPLEAEQQKSAGESLYNALRYSDYVDADDKGKRNILYYASKGLRPLYNIPLALTGEKNIQETAVGSYFTAGEKLIRSGGRENDFELLPGGIPITKEIRKDPLGTLVQVPAEVGLAYSGGKLIELGSGAIKKYSPLLLQSKKILLDDKPTTIIRSLTWKDRPLVSIQGGKIVRGYNPELLPFDKMKSLASSRSGFEASVGSGIEKEIFYGEVSLSSQVARDVIPSIAKQRAQSGVKLLELTKGIKPKVGDFGKAPIKDLSDRQSKYLLGRIVEGQKKGTIDLVHGSTALKPQIAKPIQREAGSSLQLGDIDVVPKGKNLEKVGGKLIEDFGRDFPLEAGQKLKITNPVGKNKALILSDKTGEKKIFEVVLKEAESSGSGITTGSKIAGYNIPFKESVKAKDIPVKLHSARYQQLTNTKQVLAYQKGDKTLLDIFTSSGRTKDIVRAYWKARSDAFIVGGEKGKLISAEAEHFRSLYNIEFTDINPEKILISSSKPIRDTVSQVTGEKIVSARTVTESSRLERKPQSKMDSLSSKDSIKNSSSLLNYASSKIDSPSSRISIGLSAKPPSVYSQDYGKPSLISSKYDTPSTKPSRYETPSLKPSRYDKPSIRPLNNSFSKPLSKPIRYDTPSVKPSLELIVEPIPPPKKPIAAPPPKVRISRISKPSPLISKKSWRGNVPEFDITGIYKKEIEVTYLKKRRGKKKPLFDRMVKKIL